MRERTREWQGRCFKVYGKECHQSKYFSANDKLLRLGKAEMKHLLVSSALGGFAGITARSRVLSQ